MAEYDAIHHSYQTQWPQRGLSWTQSTNAKAGEALIKPLQYKSEWRESIMSVIDKADGRPKSPWALMDSVDKSFAEMITAATKHIGALAKENLFDLFSRVRQEVPWVSELEEEIILAIFTEISEARAKYGNDYPHEFCRDVSWHCEAALAMDQFETNLATGLEDVRYCLFTWDIMNGWSLSRRPIFSISPGRV